MKKINGPTPCGGAYATITYLDDSGKVVDETIATKAIACEFDENGKLLQETFLKLKKEETKYY